jgi:uncharacterized protein YdaU (DUF1376 family)
MYYYKHHIGDFDRNTRHLSRIERSIYLDMIFLYYESEAALPLDVAALCRKIVARTEEEKSAVLAVLDEFFHETPNGWFHDRCEEELAEYRKTKSQASDAGKASAQARKERRELALGKSPRGVERRSNENPTTVERPLNDRATEAQRTVNETSTNHKPLTTNQEPIQKVKPIVEPVGPTRVIGGSVGMVFTYWQNQRGHEKAKLDDRREKAIKARLKDGYSVEDLCRAVDGIAKSPHHMGQNDSRTVYDDIELICRSAANVDKFRKLAAPSGALNPALQHQVDILTDWMNQP